MSFIKNIKKNGTDILLYKCPSPVNELLVSGGKTIKIAFIDTETTGLNHKADEIIELALKIITFERQSGKIVSVDHSYTSFNQPKKNINENITIITGINDKMVKNQFIDWKKVDSLLINANLIISHNASFDKPFMDNYSIISSKTQWACSIKDIDWLEKGFISSKQELLCFWHGFYFEAHRAMNDVNALIHLLTHNSYIDNKPILELVKNSETPTYIIWVTNFPFNEDKKNVVKINGYGWNVIKKLWSKSVKKENIEGEKIFLTNLIYNDIFKGEVEELKVLDKYKI